MESCATRICKALEIRGMKQIELAERTKIPKSAISQYCSGAFKPKQQRLFLIAHVLNVDEAWLMGLDVPMERVTNAERTSLLTKNSSVNPKPSFDPQLSLVGSSATDTLTEEEGDLIRKYRCLDQRGKSAVRNVLEYEYQSLPGDTASPAPKKA